VKHRSLRLAFVALLVLVALSVTERPARALGPVDLEFGARGGIATKPDSGPASPFGLGLGARAGISVFSIYGGVSLMHYFGTSADLPAPRGAVTSRYSSTLLGVELGYNITIIPKLLLRPQLGVGSVAFSFGEDSSQSHLYLEPGVTLLLLLGNLYLGADANVLAVPNVERDGDRTFAALTVHAQIGLRF
jgi:hypothetical protein